MGQAIAASVEQHEAYTLAGVWRRGADLDALVNAADVVVDFSLPEASSQIIDAVVRHQKPLVCGVTGLSPAGMATLDEAATRIPLVFDRNMSLGIAVLLQSVRKAAASLGPEFSVEVFDVHHIHKKDAPSGTALQLGQAIAESRGESDTGTVRFESERRGEVPGDHQVIMRSATEMLTFAHSVATRQVFVDGALRAAKWVVGRSPGRYSMQDVLFG